MPFSIVVPAYNEAAIIQHTLSYLLTDGELVDVNIIVVCNGCHDGTADIVNSFKEQQCEILVQRQLNVIVVETDVASKTNAINLGIENAAVGNVILLDADIEVSGLTLLSLNRQLNESGKDLIAPMVKFDYQGSTAIVQQYYRVDRKSTRLNSSH